MIPTLPTPRSSRKLGNRWAVPALLLVALACGTPCSAAVEGADPYWSPRLEQSPDLRHVIEALRSLRDPRAPRGPELVQELSPAAGAHLEELFVILRDGAVPALGETLPQPLSEPQLELTLQLFSSTKRRAVLSALDQFIEATGPDRDAPPVTRVAIRAIGAVGKTSDLRKLFDRAGDRELGRSSERALRNALSSILARDPTSLEWLDRHRTRLESSVLPAVVLAIGDAGDARATLLLADLALANRELAIMCLSQIHALGASQSRGTNEFVRDRVRGYLDSDQPMVRRAAMLALGRLYDDVSVPLIAAALDEPGRGAREDAATALRSLSGLALSSEAATWQAWYESERTWFENKGNPRLEALQSKELGEVVEAIRELSQHPLHRLVISFALEGCLLDPRPTVRKLACSALEHLGTPESAGMLRQALEDPEPKVCEAAQRALASLATR